MKGRDLLIGGAGGAILFALLTNHQPAKAPGQPVRLSSTAPAQASHVAPGGGTPLLFWLAGPIALALILSIAALIAARRRGSPPDIGADENRLARARLEAAGSQEPVVDWSAEISELQGRIQALADQAGAASRAAGEATTELVRRLRADASDQLAKEALALRAVMERLEERAGEIDSRLSETTGELATLRRRWLADQHDLAGRLADVSGDVAYLDRHLAPVEQALRHHLSPGAGTGLGLAGALSTGQLAASAGLRQLYLALCRALPVEVSYTEPAGDGGSRFLLSWAAPDGARPGPVLAKLLRACADPAAGPRPGLDEFRALLLGLHCAAPSGAELGPLVVSSTEHHLFAEVTDAAGDDGLPVDLTEWARDYVLQPARQ